MTITDITIQQQTVTSLQKSLSRLEKIASRVPGVMFQFKLSADGRYSIPYSSKALYDIFKIYPDDVREDATVIFNHIYAADYANVIFSIHQSAQNLSLWQCVFRVNFNDGSVHWLEGTASPEREADGSTLWHGFVSDVTERQQMEEALRLSEALYRSIIEDQSELICRYLPNGKLTFVNGAYARYYKKTPTELINTNFIPHIPDPDISIVQKKLAEISPNNPQVNYSHRIITPDGKIRWQHWTQRGIYSADGKILKYQAVGNDITAQKRVDETHIFLSQSVHKYTDESFFQSLARYLAECLGMNFVCIDILESDGLTARTLAIYHDGAFKDNMTYTLKDTPCGSVVGNEICCYPANVCQIFPKDAELKSLHAQSYLGIMLWNSAGQAIGLLAIIDTKPLVNKDVAESILKIIAVRAAGEIERKQIELKTQSLINRNQVLMDNALEGIHILDEQGNVLEVNPAFCSLLGYTHEEALQLNLADWEAKIPPNQLPAAILHSLHGQTVFETQHRRKDGSIIDVEVGCVPVVLDGKKYLYASAKDITERKQAEAELRIAATVFESQVGMTVTDASTKIIKVNQAFTQITGYSAEEVFNQKPSVLQSGAT